MLIMMTNISLTCAMFTLHRIQCLWCPLIYLSWTTPQVLFCPAGPQLYFTRYLRPSLRDGRSLTGRHKYGEDDMAVQMMFYSTFKVQRAGPARFWSDGNSSLCIPSPTPILYVGPVSNVLRQVPLILLFLHGNSTPTILHCFSNLQRIKNIEFPYSGTSAQP